MGHLDAANLRHIFDTCPSIQDTANIDDRILPWERAFAMMRQNRSEKPTGAVMRRTRFRIYLYHRDD